MEFMGAMLRVDGRASAFPVKVQIDSPWGAGFSFSGQAYGKVSNVITQDDCISAEPPICCLI